MLRSFFRTNTQSLIWLNKQREQQSAFHKVANRTKKNYRSTQFPFINFLNRPLLCFSSPRRSLFGRGLQCLHSNEAALAIRREKCGLGPASANFPQESERNLRLGSFRESLPFLLLLAHLHFIVFSSIGAPLQKRSTTFFFVYVRDHWRKMKGAEMAKHNSRRKNLKEAWLKGKTSVERARRRKRSVENTRKEKQFELMLRSLTERTTFYVPAVLHSLLRWAFVVVALHHWSLISSLSRWSAELCDWAHGRWWLRKWVVLECPSNLHSSSSCIIKKSSNSNRFQHAFLLERTAENRRFWQSQTQTVTVINLDLNTEN